MSAACLRVAELDVSGRDVPEVRLQVVPICTADDLIRAVDADSVFEPIGYLDVLELDGEQRKLRWPLKYEVEKQGPAYSIFAPSILLGASGKTIEDAVRRLSRLVVETWQEYANVPLAELHPSAIVHATKLRVLFAS